jgi:hypothetical protein
MLFATAWLHHQPGQQKKKIGSYYKDTSAARINDTTLFTTTRCGVAELVEPLGRILILSTGKGVPVKQIAERHIVGDLGFVNAVADLVHSTDTRSAYPWFGF